MAENVRAYNAEDMKDASFAKDGMVLMDFWAPWCGPCRMLAPVIEELSEEIKDVTFGKMNIDDNMEMAIGLGIASIPTLILFKDGEAVERMIGVQSGKVIQDMIDRHR